MVYGSLELGVSGVTVVCGLADNTVDIGVTVSGSWLTAASAGRLDLSSPDIWGLSILEDRYILFREDTYIILL